MNFKIFEATNLKSELNNSDKAHKKSSLNCSEAGAHSQYIKNKINIYNTHTKVRCIFHNYSCLDKNLGTFSSKFVSRERKWWFFHRSVKKCHWYLQKLDVYTWVFAPIHMQGVRKK